MTETTKQPAALPLPPFATPEQLQAHTKGKIKAVEPRVAPMLEAISNEMRREAGWHIWPVLQGHELVLDGAGGRVQPVPSMRLERVLSASSAGVTIPPEALDFSRLGLLEVQGGFLWTRRYGQVRLVIDHGFPSVPELRQLCLSLAARALASPLGATREQAGSLSVNWAASAGVSGSIIPSSDERATIARYKTVEA